MKATCRRWESAKRPSPSEPGAPTIQQNTAPGRWRAMSTMKSPPPFASYDSTSDSTSARTRSRMRPTWRGVNHRDTTRRIAAWSSPSVNSNVRPVPTISSAASPTCGSIRWTPCRSPGLWNAASQASYVSSSKPRSLRAIHVCSRISSRSGRQRFRSTRGRPCTGSGRARQASGSLRGAVESRPWRLERVTALSRWSPARARAGRAPRSRSGSRPRARRSRSPRGPSRGWRRRAPASRRSGASASCCRPTWATPTARAPRSSPTPSARSGRSTSS